MEHRNFTPLSDEEFINYTPKQENSFTPLSDEEFITGRPSAADDVKRTFGWGPQPEDHSGSRLTDPLVALAKGATALGSSVIDAGLSAASGVANAFIDDDRDKVDFNYDARQTGFDPEGWQQYWHERYSPETQAALQKVGEAQGIVDTTTAYFTNPSAIFATATESLPGMVPVFRGASLAAKAAQAGAATRQLVGKSAEKYIARRAAIGGFGAEAGVTGAALSQQIGQENLSNGRAYNEGQEYVVPGALASAAISLVNPMEARIATRGMITRAALKEGKEVNLLNRAGFKGMMARTGWDVAKEGLMEEGPQNVVEGIASNVATGKPWDEDMGKNYAEGAIVGGAMGLAMHPFAHGTKDEKGTVEQAINNDSAYVEIQLAKGGSRTIDISSGPQSEDIANQMAQEAFNRGDTVYVNGQKYRPNTEDAEIISETTNRPKTPLNPEEQAQAAEAIKTGVANPNAQVQQPVETQQPTMSSEEAELAQMEAEESARRQAVIDKYGLEFNREHGAAFADVTRNITDEAEKDFHAKILQAAGMMGIKNPFKEKGAAANFATEYKTFGGDLAKLAEFYRNIGIKAENDAGKKQGALRQAEFYQQLADLLEGGELLNFEQRRARKKEKKAAQAAEIQAAQVQRTAEQMLAQDPTPVEAQHEAKTQPKPAAEAPAFSGVIPSEEEMSDMKYDRTRQYRGEVTAVMSRLEKEGKITPEQKEKVFGLFNRNPKHYRVIDNYKAAMHALKDIENPPPPKKVKPESGLERAQKDAIKRTANSILTSAENLPASVGYTPEQRTAFKAQHAGLLSIQKSKFSASKKELEDWSEAHAVGDFEKATAIYDKYKARQRAKSYETLVKDLEDDVEGKAEFLEAVKRRDWQQAINIAENTMDLTPRDLIKSVKSKKAVVSDTAADGEYEIATEDSYENEPSRQLEQREADENDLTKVGGQVTTDAIRIEPYKGEIAPDVRETAKMLYEDREGLDAALSREGGKQDQSAVPLFYALLEQAMQAKDNAMARKLASMIKRVQKKPALLENEKPDEAPKLTKEEAKKEEAPKKSSFGEALKKAFDEAKERTKTEGEKEPVVLKGSVPKPPKSPFKAAAVEETKAAEEAGKAAVKKGKKHSEGTVKIIKGEDIKEKIDVTSPKEKGKVDFSKKLEAADKARTEEMKAAEEADKAAAMKEMKTAEEAGKAAAMKEAKKPDPTATSIPAFKLPESPFEENTKKEESQNADDLDWVDTDLASGDFSLNDLSYVADEDFYNEFVAPDVDKPIYDRILDAEEMSDEEFVKHLPITSEDSEDLRDWVDSEEDPDDKKMVRKSIKNHKDRARKLDHKKAYKQYLTEKYNEYLKKKGVEVVNGKAVKIGDEKAKADAKAVVLAVEGKEKDAKAVAKAEMKVRSILESMQDYLDGKRKKRLSENQVELVEELKDKGFLFVDDEKVLDDYKKRIETKFGKATRHASKSAKRSLTEKQKKQNYNGVRNGLNKSWGVSTTKALLDSGKVVICDSNEGFIDTIVKDYLAKDPSLSEDEVRNTLREEGFDKGTNAVYDENTGKVYINGENVDENEAGSVLAHEVGVHAAKDSEFKELIKDIEDRVATLMAEGLKSKNPAAKNFWEEVKRRMDDAGESDNEERLAYFLEVYVKQNGVVPQSIKSEMYQAIGQLKDWLLKFLGIKSINEHKAAELLCDVVRAYADQSAMEKGSGRHASKKGKSDKPKKPRKQLTPEEKAKKEQEKLAKMTPSQRASYERQKKIAKLKKEAQKQKDFREGEAYRAQTAPSVEGYNKLRRGESLTKVAEDEIKDAKGEVKDKLTLWQKGLLYLKKAAKTFNDSFLKFTNDLVDDISKECPAAKVWFGEMLEWAKDIQMYRDEAQKIFSQFDTLSKESKDEVESLLFESTTSGAWAFDISDWKDAEGNNLDNTKFAISPALEKRFNALADKDPKAAMVVYDTLKHGYDRFIQIKTKIDTVGKAVFGDKYRSMIKTPKSVVPYVPLTRTGQYNVVWRSNQLKAERQMLKKLKEQKDALEAEEKEIPSALTNAIKNTEEKIDAMERSADHYIVSRFDSLAEAGDYQKKLSNIQSGNKATLMDIGDQQKKSLTGQANIDRMLSDFEEKFEEHYGKGMGTAMRQTVQEMFLESAQKTMHSATKQRRNVAGANPHVMETFMHHANTDAWMLSNLDHGKNISNAFTALGKEVREYRDSPTTENQQRATEINDTFNELSKRYSFLTQREQHSKVDDAVEGMRGFNTFSMLSLKPSYYVQNALQPIAMTMPYLSGEFTLGQTVAEMTRSYREMKNLVGAALKTSHTARQKWHAFSSIMDAIQKSKMPKDEKDMLLDMERRNLLDLGAQADFGSFRGNNAVLKALNKGMTEIGYAARAVELANRYVTATAAYRMMKTKLLSQGNDTAKAEADAKEYAAKILSKTQGDYSGLNAPSAFNTKVGKLALQFRKFQAIQLNYFLDMLRGSFKGATEEERKICRKQLRVAIATHFMLAGLNGVPAMTLAYMLAGALAGDDGEEDEDTIRRLLREAGLSSDMVDVVLTGPMSGIGINLSNSVGAGQMFSPVPYTRKGLSEEGGMMELLTSIFGGATGSMLVKLHTGAVQSLDNSNWRPFFEALAPAGVPQIAKAIGVTDITRDKKTGKKFLTDEEITAWHRVVQALGFTPAPLERKYRMQNQAYRTQQFFKDEVADIKRRWIEAMDEHDYRAQAEIRKDVRELAKRQMSKGLKPVTMNDLMTAHKTWKKEEKLMQRNHGLKLPNSQQGLARQLIKVHNE